MNPPREERDTDLMRLEFVLPSVDHTRFLGSVLGAVSSELIPVVFVLSGPLGSGKTFLTRAIASGLGIREEVISPTFTILRVHEGKIPLFHFDFYRVKNPLELVEAGFYDLAGTCGVTVIEWADKFPDEVIFPGKTVRIHLQHEKNGGRKVTVDLGELTEEHRKKFAMLLRKSSLEPCLEEMRME